MCHPAAWPHRPCSPRLVMGLLLGLSALCPAAAQDEYEKPPIEYSARTPDNCVSRLQAKLARGAATLAHSPEHGYLRSLLTALGVPTESQTLVFSKTSLQIRRITPKTPRAIYFNDEVYVGFCQKGDVLEISAVDRELGTVFYTLDQEPTATPTFTRHNDSCLVCHSSSRTEGIPGHLVRSLYVDAAGYPVLSAGSRTVNHTTPFEKRWGGWYVTGEHGAQSHLGNYIADKDVHPDRVDNEPGQNRRSVADLLPVGPYLTPHSDIVALMVLEHQTFVHNRLTWANFATRQALAYDAMMNEVLKNPPGVPLESTTRRIASASEKLLEALLLAEEAPLTAAVRGTSGYAEWFVSQGPRDAQGRSLRELDLRTRLFKYPCSYLIYSEAYTSLPPAVKTLVERRLVEILEGTADDPKYAHLSTVDRTAIREILRDTGILP